MQCIALMKRPKILKSISNGWKKRSVNTSAAEKELDRCRQAARMLRGTENVAVIDSFVVDKNNFLSAYKIK